MTQFRADIHCHSTHSDGTFSPSELLELAQKANLTGFAITDHDAISAYPEVENRAKELGIQLLTGVELSTVHNDFQVHILGYAFDPKSSALQEFCSANRLMRLERNLEILEKLASHGMKLEESDIVEAGHEYVAYGRPHIAQAMVKKGYIKSPTEAFRQYIGEGKSCYSPGKKISTCEAIDIIHQAKGKAVIAHPHLIHPASLVQELLGLNFDGIEAFYCHFSEKINRKWAKIAEEKGWFTTGGSDFHGTVRPDVQLGEALTPEPVFLDLWNHFQSIRFH